MKGAFWHSRNLVKVSIRINFLPYKKGDFLQFIKMDLDLDLSLFDTDIIMANLMEWSKQLDQDYQDFLRVCDDTKTFSSKMT